MRRRVVVPAKTLERPVRKGLFKVILSEDDCLLYVREQVDYVCLKAETTGLQEAFAAEDWDAMTRILRPYYMEHTFSKGGKGHEEK